MKNLKYFVVFSLFMLFPGVVFICLTEDEANDTEAGEERNVLTDYVKSRFFVPMRDGVLLDTAVYRPEEGDMALPIILLRTPYSFDRYDEAHEISPSPRLLEEKFIFVIQNVRGRFGSQGEFNLLKPPTGPINESTDAYDTIDWLIGNIPGNNGKVGQWGISYDGWLTVMGMRDSHPALAASSPQASPSDLFIGDDWFHNGAFRWMHAFSWLKKVYPTESGRQSGENDRMSSPDRGYRYFLDLVNPQYIDDHVFGGKVKEWRSFMDHGTYDDYWSKRNFANYLTPVSHPVLHVAGWFDPEDFYGPLAIYRKLERLVRPNDSTLVIGPWDHGGWRSSDGSELHGVKFGSKTAKYYRDEIVFPFFACHLKNKCEGKNDYEAVVFDTGDRKWNGFDFWPPANARPLKIYFDDGNGLSFREPEDRRSMDYDSYISDPLDPVPYSAEIGLEMGSRWMVEDQRFTEGRRDILKYETTVLSEDITVAGPIDVNLYVSTTGTDSDWIVKVIDVYPAGEGVHEVGMSGYQFPVGAEIMRGKFRADLSSPRPMVSGQSTPVKFRIHDRHHTFKAGHRIMVHVQSSWFPMFDRNPQTYTDIFRADPDHYVATEQRLYRSAEHPSHLTFSILR